MKEAGLKRGQPITFRIPSDTTDHTLRQLQKLKEEERRNFSSTIARFVLDGVNNTSKKQQEVITIPLPKGLSKAQRDWLKHEQSEALLGSIVYELMADPVRTAALMASLKGEPIDYYPEVEETVTTPSVKVDHNEDLIIERQLEDDLDSFDLTSIEGFSNSSFEEEEEVDPLGDFLAQMNK